MTTPRNASDDDLHAYADDLLVSTRRAEIEAVLARDPEAAARVAFYRQLNADLHRLYGGVSEEPANERRIARAARPLWQQVALAASILVAGLVGGWFARDWAPLGEPATRITRTVDDADWPVQAARAHVAFAVERRHPVEVTADDEAHLVQWLSIRLGQPVRAAKLDSLGFRLVGGRLLPRVDGGVAGQFMYERTVARAGEPARPHRASRFTSNQDQAWRAVRSSNWRPMARGTRSSIGSMSASVMPLSGRCHARNCLRSRAQSSSSLNARLASMRRYRPSAATPGNSLPSIHSRNAPPAVET